MPYDISCCRPGLLTAFALMLCCLLAGCNFSDPLTGPPLSGCQDDGDCDDHGICEIDGTSGTCSCDPGYDGEDCSDCATGYAKTPARECKAEMTSTNNNTNNNTIVTCEDDEILFDGMCVVDGCIVSPCGDGTCTTLEDGTAECLCPDDTTAPECPSCAADCVNGTCDATFTCVCERGWAGDICNACAPGFEGANCDQCVMGAFGPNCDSCAALSVADPWWDTGYQARQALVVYNSAGAALPVRDGAIVQHTFMHSQLVTNGADPGGLDVRVVNNGAETNRVLGFDSAWNRTGTTIWFPTVTAIPAPGVDVYYIYTQNPSANAALEDPSAVLRQDRGWYTGANGPVYSPAPLTSGAYSVQLRQKNPMTMQVYFHDSGNNGTASVVVRLIDTATNVEVGSFIADANQGSAGNPVDIFQDLPQTLTNSMRLDVIIDPGADLGVEVASVYLGSQRVYSGTTSSTYQGTLTRSVTPSAVPSVFSCPPEMVP